MEFAEFQIVHGSLINPVEEYLTDINSAIPTFELMAKSLLFVGHTHVPMDLSHEGKKIINPGSVGQPRDGDPRASFIIYDGLKKELSLFRVNYDIEAVQRKMEAAGLPRFLIERLSFGR